MNSFAKLYKDLPKDNEDDYEPSWFVFCTLPSSRVL